MYEGRIINYKEDAWLHWSDYTICIKTGNYDDFSKGSMLVDTIFNKLNLYNRSKKLTDNKLLISIRVLYNV